MKLRKTQEVVPYGFRHWEPMECLNLDHFALAGKLFLVAVCRGTRDMFYEHVKDETVQEKVKKVWILFKDFCLP